MRSTHIDKLKRLFQLLPITFVSFCSLAQSPAQTAAVTIQVMDISGAVIPGAQLRIVPYESTEKLITGPNGTMTVQLVPGGYEIFARAPGFKASKSKLEIVDSTARMFSITLNVGSVSGPVEIPDYSPEELELLKLENSFWQKIGQSDADRCESFWRPDGIAMLGNVVTNGKESVGRFLRSQKSVGLRAEEITAAVTGIKVEGHTGFTFSRVTSLWVDKFGRGEPTTARVAHTWTRVGGHWQIIGEFSTN